VQVLYAVAADALIGRFLIGGLYSTKLGVIAAHGFVWERARAKNRSFPQDAKNLVAALITEVHAILNCQIQLSETQCEAKA
jgi:hypothetical protein